MKLPFFLLMLLLIVVRAQSQPNAALKRELDSMLVLDQRYREYMGRLENDKALKDSLLAVYGTNEANLMSFAWGSQSRIDSSDLKRTEQILKQYGYPGKTLVGEPANETVFYIIQHSDKIDAYLPLVKKAAETNELAFSLYAMMVDRALMYQKKPQIYGTQASCRNALASGKEQCFIWPLTDYKTVNVRRKKAGFTTTIEQNAKRLNAVYKPMTVAQVLKTYQF
jgi:hypothetical protein